MYLLLHCLAVCFLGIPRLLHCENHADPHFLFSLLLPKHTRLVRLPSLFLTLAAFQHKEPTLRIHAFSYDSRPSPMVLDLLLWFKDSETSPNPRAVTADTHPSQSPPAQFGTMEWKATILAGRQCCRGEVGVASSSMLFLLSSLCLSDAPS